MLIHQQPDAVSARQGHLDSRRVWRLPVLGDDKVFLRSDEESTPGFTVDLLLDGSASRLHCQETIVYSGKKPCGLRHSCPRQQLLQSPGLYGAAGAEGFRREKRRTEDF